MEPIILIHASDFHVKEDEHDPFSLPNDIRNLFLFDTQELSKKLGSPTAFVFSGDIACSGKPAQYDVARIMFTKILESFEIKEQRIFVVPGNHDIDRSKTINLNARVLRDSLRFNAQEISEKKFISKREELLDPLHAFQEFAMPYDCLIGGENGYWEIGNIESNSSAEYLDKELKIIIRGISTVHVSDRNDEQMTSPENPEDYGSHMYVARGQLVCDPATDDGPFRLLIGHHPPVWWRFSDERKTLANARYHLQLFGHEHQFSPRTEGNAVFVTAGAVNPHDYLLERARYNWIKISREEQSYIVRIWSRVFDNKQQRFVEDSAWPSGQGYRISPALNAEAVLVEAETVVTGKVEVKISQGEHKDNVCDLGGMIAEVPTPSAVRFALLSQSHAKYALVFKMLGYEPDDSQKYSLGGLEYYKESLQELLRPEVIQKLIDVMKEVGIDVN